jgi:hypothetical protein
MVRALLLLATLCAALISGVVFSHALQRGEKRRLTGPVFVQVQNTLYNRYGNFVGPMEVAALVLLLILLFVLPPDGVAIWLVAVAALCLAVMIGIWAAGIRPLNIEIRRWTPEVYPDEWARYRDRWARLHLLRMIAAMIALALLLLVLSTRPVF